MHEFTDVTVLLTAMSAADSPQERELLEDQVVREYLPWAERLAARYRHRGVDTEELVAVANLALVKAVRRFDTARGSFHAYATSTMLGEIKKYFRDSGWMIRPTRAVQELQPRIRHAIEQLSVDGAEPTIDEIAAHLDADRSAVVEAMDVRDHFTARSLDAPASESGRPLGELVPSDDIDGFALVDDLVTVAAGCSDLSSAELDLLRMRFFDDMTQSEIADVVGVSQMQVSRRLARLVEKIRSSASITHAA